MLLETLYTRFDYSSDNSGLLLAVRNPGSCFASRIPLLLRNRATKYQANISIVRQAPRVAKAFAKSVVKHVAMS